MLQQKLSLPLHGLTLSTPIFSTLVAVQEGTCCVDICNLMHFLVSIAALHAFPKQYLDPFGQADHSMNMNHRTTMQHWHRNLGDDIEERICMAKYAM